jgi:hypothetical protein
MDTEVTDEVSAPAKVDTSELDDLLELHAQGVQRDRKANKNHRDSFSDKFWGDKQDDAAEIVGNINTIPKFAVNRMMGWVRSYIASLFYRGFAAEVGIDEVYEDDDKLMPKQRLVKSVLDRFYNTPRMKTVTEQSFTAGLLYTHSAFYLREVPTASRLVDRVVVEFMPPWECVWDKRSASAEDARYLGRSWWVPIEDAGVSFGLTRERAVERGALTCKPDVLVDGWYAKAGAHADNNYVRILDISYPKSPSVVNGVTVYGKRCVYLLTPDGKYDSLIFEKPIRVQDPDGRPDVNIEPVVLTSFPEAPLHGISGAATIYALECENNIYAAWMAQAFRMEALRKLLVDLSAFDDEGRERIASGKADGMILGVKAGQLSQGAKAIASWMESPPSPTSGVALRGFIEQHFEAVSGTAPVTRGQPTQYIPATESANLSAYSETTLGLLRGKEDAAVAAVGGKYLRYLAVLCEDAKTDTVPVRVDKDVEGLPVSNLKMRWTIRIVDGANTPAKAEAQKRDSLQLLPMLMQMIPAIVQSPQPEAIAAFKGMWDMLVKRFGLDEKMKWDEVTKGAVTEAPAPPSPPAEIAGVLPAGPPPAPPGPPAGLTSEQAAALDSDAAAEDELDAMLGGG